MTTYMGPSLASMVPVECVSALTSTPQTRADVVTNMAGRRRIYVDQAGVPPLRTWQCNIDVADPNSVATLAELESLRVPLRFLSDSAVVNNVLPPAASMGPVGWLSSVGSLQRESGRLLLAGPPVKHTPVWVSTPMSPATLYSPLFPVISTRRVQASVHVLAKASQSATLFLDWMSPSASQGGAEISVGASDSTTATSGAAPLLSVFATPPAGTLAARLRMTGVDVFARPSAAWSQSPVPWRPGEGAECVHLSPLVQDSHHVRVTGESYAAFSFTVTEATP